MGNFFTSPEDLQSWIKGKNKNYKEAANKIIGIIGTDREEDIVETCKSVFNDDKNAANVLFQILSKYGVTSIREGKIMNKKIIKEAQIMRQPGQYIMPLRVCPKLPYSVGKGLISTYNCRHYCLDGLTLDDDPDTVYCAEALWRRHVMDKFSREFKDKDGKFVGGYLNERFQTFRDDGGNQMELANGERTRLPRPHQYSIERRMSEARGEKTTDITASSEKSIVRLASTKTTEEVSTKDVYKMFDDIVEMREAKLSDEDIITKVAEHYKEDIVKVAELNKLAGSMMKRNDGIIYSYAAYSNLPAGTNIVTKSAVKVKDEAGNTVDLEINTPCTKIAENNFEIADGKDAGKKFSLLDQKNDELYFEVIEDSAVVQDDATNLGLNAQNIV